jgi:hypothetical protein
MVPASVVVVARLLMLGQQGGCLDCRPLALLLLLLLLVVVAVAAAAALPKGRCGLTV